MRRPGPASPASSGSSSPRRRTAPASSPRAAELLGLDEVWALGGPQAIAALAYGTETIAPRGQDRRPGERIRERGEARSSRATSPIDLPAGPSEVVVARRRRRRPRRSPSSSSPPSASTGPTPSAVSSKPTATSRARSRASRSSRPSTSSCSARRPRRSRRAFATPAPSSSARGRRSPRATTRPAGTTCCPPAAGRARSAGSGSRRSSSRSRSSGSRREGLARLRPIVEALAAARGHARARGGGAAMRALPAEFAAYTWAPSTRRARARASGSTRSQIVRFDGNVPACAAPVLAARARSPARSPTSRTVPARRLHRADRRASRDYAGVEPENVVLGAGADDLILLCARAFAGPGRRGRDRRRADLSALPHRRAARRRRGRRRRSRRHVLLPAEQPDRRARRAPGGAAARRRRGVLRVRGRDRGRAASTTASSSSGRSRRRSGSPARASATRSPTRRPPPS